MRGIQQLLICRNQKHIGRFNGYNNTIENDFGYHWPHRKINNCAQFCTFYTFYTAVYVFIAAFTKWRK